MTRRCGCDEDGDETVFGPCKTCAPQPEAAQVDLVGALFGAIQRAREARRSDFTLSPPQEPREQPWEIVLDADERGGR